MSLIRLIISILLATGIAAFPISSSAEDAPLPEPAGDQVEIKQPADDPSSLSTVPQFENLPDTAKIDAALSPRTTGEKIALNSPVTDEISEIAPAWLPTGRDIRIELLPEPEPAASEAADNAGKSDLWVRIREGYALPDSHSKLVSKYEKWYSSHPDYVARMTERARRYLYYIMEEVERRGMPTEIALLPMIESAFNPGANSIASASGIWQFIPSTGRNFGMEQNWWYDGRRDIIGATNGALDYLQKLYDQFGDWELALAAYNWGENGVARAQAYNRRHKRATDYEHLRMPRETRNYVPKLIAVRHIVTDPAKFNLTLSDIPDEPYFETVATSQHIDVKLAAELADISMEEFNALNPGLNRPVILQDTTNLLLLPVDKVETFRNNLAKTNQRLVSWQPYESKKGERFDQIAERFGLSLDELRSANGFSKYSHYSNGQTLLVPITDEDNAAEFTAFNMHASAMKEMLGTVRYTVRRGDTISAIADRFHVSQAQLIEANQGRTFLRVGQHFNIVLSDRPYRKHGKSVAAYKPDEDGIIHYQVQRGDTISGIALRFRVSQAQLIEANNGSTLLQVGQQISFASRSTSTKSASVTPVKQVSINSLNEQASLHGKSQI